MIVFFRAILLYILIIFAVRMMGKRQLADMQPSDIVATILISNIASLPIEDTSLPMMSAIIPILTLAAFEITTSEMGLRSRKLRLLFSGRPRVIIKEGVIDQKAMREVRITLDDLLENLRGEGVFDLKDVWYCIAETNGKLNVLQRFPAKQLTPKDMQLKGSDTLPPVTVISDGKMLPEAMQFYGISKEWLKKILELEKKKAEDIFVMTVDGNLQYLIVDKARK